MIYQCDYTSVARHAVCLFVLMIVGISGAYADSSQCSASPVPQGRNPTLTISPVTFSDSVTKRQRDRLDEEALLSSLRKGLLGTGKFDIATVESDLLNEITDLQEYNRINRAPGSSGAGDDLSTIDYMVRPIVRRFIFASSFKPVPNMVNKYRRSDFGSIRLTLEIYDIETATLRVALNISERFGTDEYIVGSRSPARPSRARLISMLDKAGISFGDQLNSFLYPMRVLLVRDDRIWINRGQDSTLRKGQRLDVFRPGIALRDPVSGEFLECAEVEKVARVRVSRINPKVTIATVERRYNGLEINEGDIVSVP